MDGEYNKDVYYLISAHTQQIEKGWKNQTSAHYYTFPQFRDFILELADDNQQIYDVLYQVFKETSNMPKTSITQMKVGRIKHSDNYISRLYNMLRNSMKAPTSLSLPFNVKSK